MDRSQSTATTGPNIDGSANQTVISANQTAISVETRANNVEFDGEDELNL